MEDNRLMRQVSAIFGLFMVFFYLGFGIFIIFFFKNTYLERTVLVMIGSAFIFYGLYRAFRTYQILAELFFRKGRKDE